MNKYSFKIILFFVILGLLSGGYIVVEQRKTPSNNPNSSANTISSKYPITIKSCGEDVKFESAPKRVLSFDTNMTEILLALALEDKMVGYWISGVPVAKEYQEKVKNIPIISKETSKPPGMETILSYNPDFIFGAWNYNFSEEGGVTPKKLTALGIKSYVLTESCIATGMKPDTTLEGTYQDIINLGTIFGVQDRAQTIADQMRFNITTTQQKIGEVKTPLRGLYYGGGANAAFSAGKYGMASKMMSAVGAENILGDIEDDWIPEASWETIIKRDPQFIMIDDTPWESAEHRITTLQSLPQLASITAIREKKFIVFPWTYILPGVEMDEGIALLAKALYPEKFP